MSKRSIFILLLIFSFAGSRILIAGSLSYTINLDSAEQNDLIIDSFAGQTFAGSSTGDCRPNDTGHPGGSGSLTFQPFSVYPFTASVISKNWSPFCLVQMTMKGVPTCYDVFVDGHLGGYPIFSDVTSLNVGTWSYSHAIQLIPNSNVLPIVIWDCGASTNGYYSLPADGTSTAVGTIVNTDYKTYPVTFGFSGDSLGCTLTTNATGIILMAGTNYGTVDVVAQTSDPNGSCLGKSFKFNLIDPQDCQKCDVCNRALNNSVDIRLALGPSRWGGISYLKLESSVPTLDLGSPRLLECPFRRPDIQIITNSMGWIRQVRSSDRIIDITTNSAWSYSLNYYRPSQAMLFTNGLYAFSVGTNSATPFETATMQLVNGNTNHFEYTDSLRPAAADYYWENNGWKLVTGDGLRSESVYETTNGQTYTKERVICDASGITNYISAETYLTTVSNGDLLLDKITGTGANALVESNSYDSNGHLIESLHSNGSWDIYTYDSYGRVTRHYSSFENSAPTTNTTLCRYTAMTYDDNVVSGSGDNPILGFHTPRMVVKYVLGHEVSRQYTVIKQGERDEIKCATAGAAWNASDNLVTINLLQTNYMRYGQPQETFNPDGTVKITSFSNTSSGSEIVVATGVPNGSGGISNGSRQYIWKDNMGNVTQSQITDVPSGITTSLDKYSYDNFGHLTNTTYLDGTYSLAAYDCCDPEYTMNRDGLVTSYGYDALKRLEITYANGILTSNVYDAAGDPIRTVRYGTDGKSVTLNSSTYDYAGRLTSSTDGMNNTTHYTNYFNSSGGMVKKTIYPDQSTRIETYYRDGRLESLTGTAVLGVRYVYGVGIPPGENVYHPYKETIKLNSDDTDTTEWTKTYTDMLGHAYMTVYADGNKKESFYNSEGQLFKQVDPDGITRLYQYDSKGQLTTTAVDMNNNDSIDFGGDDRITSTINDVVFDHGTNVLRSRTYKWDVNGSDSSNLVAMAETSANGLDSWNVVFDNGIGVTNSTINSYDELNGYHIVTGIAPDGSFSVSTNRYGRLISITRRDSNGNLIEQTTYGYDTQGRQLTVTDARDGTTTYFYNDDDQVVSTVTPSPDGLQTGEVTTNYYDNMGRVYKRTLSDHTSQTNVYYPNGLLKLTYGSRIYPVEYTYDYAGRIKTMTTWQNYSTGSGASVTTWNYDGYRGFLTNKVYADKQGPSYSYTAAGRLKTRTWARGITTSYSYGPGGNLIDINYSDATPGVTNEYNRIGELTTVINGSTVCNRTYNNAGQLLSASYSGGPLEGLTVTNSYDQYLRRTNVALLNASASIVASSSYGYDAASRLASAFSGTASATYSYLANSPLVRQIAYTNSGALRMTTIKQYDYLNRLTKIVSTPVGSNTPPFSFDYTYNTANQRTAVTNADGSYWVYQYDNLGQVTSGKKYWSDGKPVAGRQFTYDFDDVGNRTSTASGGDSSGNNLRTANYTANDLNQCISRGVPGYAEILGSASTNATVTVNLQRALRQGKYFWDELPVDNSGSALWLSLTNLAVVNNGTNKDIIATNTGHLFMPQTPEQFQYDADGNLTNDGRWTYTWDAENRLIQMTVNTGVGPQYELTFKYDSRGRRIQKIVALNGVSISTNDFIYDGWNLVAVLDSKSSVMQSFVWGTDLSGSMQGAGGVGGLLFVCDKQDAATNFVAYDGNGNVVGLVDATDGGVDADYSYSPFGKVIRMTGPVAKENPFRFSTKYQDNESDLLYYGYRYYNPSTGTWPNRDPRQEQGGLNLYGFVNNSPIVYIDLFGLSGCNDVRFTDGKHWQLIDITHEPSHLGFDFKREIDYFDCIWEAKIKVLCCGGKWKTGTKLCHNQTSLQAQGAPWFCVDAANVPLDLPLITSFENGIGKIMAKIALVALKTAIPNGTTTKQAHQMQNAINNARPKSARNGYWLGGKCPCQ